MEVKTIKPCPFCGMQNLSIIHEEKGIKVIFCRRCGAKGPTGAITEKVALSLWDQRIPNGPLE